MALKRFAICDANGKVLNVTKMETPLTALPFPGYGATWVYVDSDARPDDPPTIDERVTYCAVKSSGPCGPGDTINLSTGVVTPLVPPVPPPPTKEELRAYAANKRWEVETGGAVYGPHVVLTDRDSQSKLIATMVAIQAGLRTDPSGWKMRSGDFVSLTNAQMLEVIGVVHAHVAGAFDVEENVIASIESEGTTTYAQIDQASWPGA